MIEDVLLRMWEDLIGRVSGPLKFRLILQPAMALFFAFRDGLKDAREGRPAYFWSFFAEPTLRPGRLLEGWRAVGRIFVLAIVIDAIYQYVMLRWFYPGEALITAFVLAFVPYLLLRGPVSRIAKLWRRWATASRPGSGGV